MDDQCGHFLFDTFHVNLRKGVFYILFLLTAHGASLFASGQLGPKLVISAIERYF